MVVFTTDSGIKENIMVEAPTLANRTPSTTVSGSQANTMALEPFSGLMAHPTKVNGRAAERTVEVSLWASTERSTKVSGWTESTMAQESFKHLTANSSLGSSETGSLWAD